MKPESKKILDKQFKKDRHFLIYGIIAFIIFINIVYILYTPMTTTTVTGIAIESSVVTTNEEPITKMHVQLDTGEIVLVTIPDLDFFKKQSEVELSKSVSVIGNVRYEFNNYKK